MTIALATRGYICALQAGAALPGPVIVGAEEQKPTITGSSTTLTSGPVIGGAGVQAPTITGGNEEP